MLKNVMFQWKEIICSSRILEASRIEKSTRADTLVWRDRSRGQHGKSEDGRSRPEVTLRG